MSDCPQIETLAAIATGRVSDPALLGHVSTCTRCRTRSRHHESDRLLLAELSSALRLASPAAADSHAVPGASALPIVEGHEIVRELHRGGQGVVFEALQLEPRRKVALKVLLEGVFASAERLRRFEREIDLVATLRHPNLVTVHRSGRTQDGRHYFTMELVEGIPLHEHAASRRALGWRTQEILELFKRICAAVGYAHQRGVVHRDLKPANVLVDAAGEPRVVDFGVAKPLAAGSAESEEQDGATRTGVFVGTLAYASPEQVRGESDQVDLRTDVYSLGVVLYELLAGEMPYASKGAFSEAVPAILDVEPPPPRGCDDELAAIVQKALAKERDRRYSSATELLGDVERYLRGEPIDAKRGRTGYLLRKAIARHRVAAAVALGVLVVVVIAAFVSTYYAREAIAAADRSQRSAQTTQRVNQFLQDMLWNLSPDQAKGRNVTVRELLDEESRRIDAELADEPEALAALHHTIGRTYASLGIADEAERHCARALAMRREGVGGEDALIDDLVANAWVCRNRGRFAQAEEHLGEALALLDARSARAIDDRARRAVILSDTAEIRAARGNTKDAEPLLRTALELMRDCGRHKDAATTLIRLGLLLQERGDLAASESRLREGLEILRQRGDLELISVARGLQHLARTLSELGRLDEAIATADEARELFRKILGDDAPFSILSLAELAWMRSRRDGYPAVESLHLEARARRPALAEREEVTCANALNGLALLAMERGDLAEADELFREALARFERLVGHEHSSVASVLQSHSWLLETRGDAAGAATRAREAVAIQRRLGAAGDPQLAGALLNLAWILFEAGRPLEAEPLAREALALREAALGGEHPDVASNRSALAYLLHCLGQNAEAERLCRAALEVQQRLAAPAPQIATSLFDLSEILASLDRPDEAEPLAREALALRRARLAKDDPDLAMSLDGLGRQLLQRGRYDESRSLLEEALAIRRKRFSRGHLHVVWSLENVGAWHYARRDITAAEPLFQEAVDTARDVLGENHPDLGVALGNLASARDALGDREAAASLYSESHEILSATYGASHPRTLRILEYEINVLEELGRADEAAARRAVLREARGAAPLR